MSDKQPKDKPKCETVEEFLARGGQIQVFPCAPYEQDNMVHPTSPTPVPLMSLDDGAHYFSEVKKRESKKNKDPLKGVDLSKLPDNIRQLFKI